MDGYVKPFIKNLKVLDAKKDIKKKRRDYKSGEKSSSRFVCQSGRKSKD